VGGVLGGLALPALTIGLMFYIRRRRRRIDDASGRGEEASPFTTPRPNPDIVHDSKVQVQDAAGGLVTAHVTFTSKGRPHTQDQNMQPGGGVGDIHEPQQPNSDTDGYQVGDTLPSAVLAQIGDAVREELAMALRTQARPLREARQGSNYEPPPEYASERGGGSEE
jgi:hypothetical protein